MTAARFAIELDREWAETEEAMRELVGLIGMQAIKGVVMKTPVDTGRARGNWGLTIGTPNLAATEKLDPGGNATISEGTAVAASYANLEGFPVIWVSNGLPYIERLEGGYSMQAPGGMVALTVAEIEAQFADVEV